MSSCSIDIFFDLQLFDCNLKGKLFDPSFGRLVGRGESWICPFDSPPLVSYYLARKAFPITRPSDPDTMTDTAVEVSVVERQKLLILLSLIPIATN